MKLSEIDDTIIRMNTQQKNRSIPWKHWKVCSVYGPGGCHRENSHGKVVNDCNWNCSFVIELGKL